MSKLNYKARLETHLKTMESEPTHSARWDAAENGIVVILSVAPSICLSRDEIEDYTRRYENIGA
jgi:hypothetical protein